MKIRDPQKTSSRIKISSWETTLLLPFFFKNLLGMDSCCWIGMPQIFLHYYLNSRSVRPLPFFFHATSEWKSVTCKDATDGDVLRRPWPMLDHSCRSQELSLASSPPIVFDPLAGRGVEPAITLHTASLAGCTVAATDVHISRPTFGA